MIVGEMTSMDIATHVSDMTLEETEALIAAVRCEAFKAGFLTCNGEAFRPTLLQAAKDFAIVASAIGRKSPLYKNIRATVLWLRRKAKEGKAEARIAWFVRMKEANLARIAKNRVH